MSTQENKEIVQRYIAAYNEQDLEVLDELTAPEYQQQTHQGLAWVYRTFPGHHMEITDAVAEEDKVWVRLATSGGYAGGWLGVPATDVQWTNTGVYFIRLAGGKIVEIHSLFDVRNLLGQLGAKVVSV